MLDPELGLVPRTSGGSTSISMSLLKGEGKGGRGGKDPTARFSWET